MEWLAASVIAVAVALGGYMWFRVRARDGALVLLACIAGAWFGAVNLMGRARPVEHDILQRLEPDEIIAYTMKEGEAIWLWVSRDEPIAYRLPWSRQTARDIHRAGSAAKAGGRPLMGQMRQGRPAGKWEFYPKPVQPLPPKGVGQ